MKEMLISSREVRGLTRDISASLRDERITPLIREAEDMYVRPAIGDALYIELLEDEGKYPVLLAGGVYEAGGKKTYCTGLKKAIAYYAYAKIILNNQTNVTSWGVGQKNITESTPATPAALDKTYNDAKAVADRYMTECLAYIDAVIRGKCCGTGVEVSTKTKITSIGF